MNFYHPLHIDQSRSRKGRVHSIHKEHFHIAGVNYLGAARKIKERMRKRVCVVGAGASGLSAIKACLEEDLEPVCYEKTSSIGGLWRYREETIEGVGSVMKSTVSNGSKEMSMFSDFVPPAHFPNFMDHNRVTEYLDMYAEHFNLFRYIHYNTTVCEVKFADDYEITGRWIVKIQDSNGKMEENIFDAVMLCVGHYAYPHIPDLNGMESFKGKIMHTHLYKTPDGFKDKRVLVIGIGNSGGDVSVELGRVAKTVYLSTRSGTWVLNRVGFYGRPSDLNNLTRFNAFVRRNLPWEVTNHIAECALNMRFHHEEFCLKPNHRAFSQHLMVNDDLPNLLQSGIVTLKDNIKHFTETGVVFENDPVEYPIDVVILATGYETRLPFISDEIIHVEKNKVALYKHIFPPSLRHPTLAVIGFIQFLGSVFPIFEIQCRWVARIFKEKCQLPPKEDMEADIRKTQDRHTENLPNPSIRHLVQIDYIDYMDEIADLIGARPKLLPYLFEDPKFFMRCMFGPAMPYQFRLNGPHPWPGAVDAIKTAEQRIRAPLQTRTLRIKPKTQNWIISTLISIIGFVCLFVIIFTCSRKKT